MQIVNPEDIVAFDLTAVLLRTNMGSGEVEGSEDLVKAINEGHEPFAITTYMVPPSPTKVGLLGQNIAPTMVEKIWFKRRQIIKADKTPTQA